MFHILINILSVDHFLLPITGNEIYGLKIANLAPQQADLRGHRSYNKTHFQRVLKTCTIHHIDFSSSRVQGLANVLKSFNTEVIDLLIVGPSKASSYLLFQQFLGQYYDYLPTVCQVNFAHTLPRAREENGFMESIQRLRSEKKFLLMGASKDRTDMHLNLFFENMDDEYCRNRYFRYLSYF
ncbi:hypothetical protein B9Z55_017792 [Caenorhabditis nigoni]|uniref:Uncharacterized protein n=1 Tax=Caenorhabditis nigoni TaxID=1611254 RepID=A0A2G5TAN9_9PELO|nr:hypothetical protein B9Z55_017792 [Caenorhabditis nigoni]